MLLPSVNFAIFFVVNSVEERNKIIVVVVVVMNFYEKKWSCDHFGGFVLWGIYLALWKYDFYGDSLLPIVTREHFVKLVRWEQLWEWSEVTGLPLRSNGGTNPRWRRKPCNGLFIYYVYDVTSTIFVYKEIILLDMPVIVTYYTYCSMNDIPINIKTGDIRWTI